MNNVAVDRVLAHGDGRFHVVFLNQTRDPNASASPSIPASSAATSPTAPATLRCDQAPATSVHIQDPVTTVDLPPARRRHAHRRRLAHRRPHAPPRAPLRHTRTPDRPRPPPPTAPRHKTRIGTELHVPPFTWRDLSVYVTANLSAATPCYSVGAAPEQRVDCPSFPGEFFIRLTDTTTPVTWRAEVTAAQAP